MVKLVYYVTILCIDLTQNADKNFIQLERQQRLL